MDVSWRGLEVGKRVKLHAVRADNAYVDHAAPMPVGTVLAIRTDEGLEITASVVRVHEQVGGSSEVPGMQIVPLDLAGAAQAWWTARVEAAPPPVQVVAEPPAPVAVQAPAPVAPSPVAALAAAPEYDPRAEITSRPTLTVNTVEVARVLAATGQSMPNTDASRTEVMTAMPDPDAVVDGVVETTASDDGLVDDGRRTMVMSSVDIAAVVEAAEAETSGPVNGDDDGPSGDGPSSDGNGAPAGGKRKRGGRRGKKR